MYTYIHNGLGAEIPKSDGRFLVASDVGLKTGAPLLSSNMVTDTGPFVDHGPFNDGLYGSPCGFGRGCGFAGCWGLRLGLVLRVGTVELRVGFGFRV